MTSLFRYPCALAMAAICFSATASAADLKIKQRTTMMGHTTENTVYFKGARERDEMSFGSESGTVLITHCDQRRMITITGKQCMVMQMGRDQASCPALPQAVPQGADRPGGDTPRKGGVVTITRTVTDTGERQVMFGYTARHIKISMTTEASPDACQKSHTKTEVDGWYADVWPEFSCYEDLYRALSCGGMDSEPQCRDHYLLKNYGSGDPGFALKETTTTTDQQQTFTITNEVVEVTPTALDSSLFDTPPGCKVVDIGYGDAKISAITSGVTATAQPEESHGPATAAPTAGTSPAQRK